MSLIKEILHIYHKIRSPDTAHKIRSPENGWSPYHNISKSVPISLTCNEFLKESLFSIPS